MPPIAAGFSLILPPFRSPDKADLVMHKVVERVRLAVLAQIFRRGIKKIMYGEEAPPYEAGRRPLRLQVLRRCRFRRSLDLRQCPDRHQHERSGAGPIGERDWL